MILRYVTNDGSFNCKFYVKNLLNIDLFTALEF
jgi:hypothetical protein